MRKRGFTLIEMLVVITLISTVVLGVLSFIRNSSGEKSTGQLQMQAELSGEVQAIIFEIKTFFNRAQKFLYTPGAGAGQGALVLAADLRACDTFDTSTSSTNLSTVGILCCSPGMSLTAQKPGGGTIQLSSACGKSWGLSILQYDSSGSLKQSDCKRNVAEMYVTTLGKDTIRNKTAPSDIINIDFVGKTALNSDGTWNPRVKSLYFHLVTSPGNILTAPVVTCSRQGLF